MKCSFGCGNDANYMVGNNRPCCSKFESSCPAMIKKFHEVADKERIKEQGVDVKLLTVAGFRSEPDHVDKANDMVQVTLALTKRDWTGLQRLLNIKSNE
jgi:hypothetical protein